MRSVTAPDGSEHMVRIEWIGSKLRRAPASLRRRLRRTADRASDLADVPDVGCLDDIGGVLAAILAIVVAAVVLIVVLSLLAGLLPSMEASRLRITDALRKV